MPHPASGQGAWETWGMQEVIVLLSEPWHLLQANLLPLTMHSFIFGRAWGVCFGVNITWAADAAD